MAWSHLRAAAKSGWVFLLGVKGHDGTELQSTISALRDGVGKWHRSSGCGWPLSLKAGSTPEVGGFSTVGGEGAILRVQARKPPTRANPAVLPGGSRGGRGGDGVGGG